MKSLTKHLFLIAVALISANAQCMHNDTPLIIAAQHVHLEIVQLLIENGVNVNLMEQPQIENGHSRPQQEITEQEREQLRRMIQRQRQLRELRELNQRIRELREQLPEAPTAEQIENDHNRPQQELTKEENLNGIEPFVYNTEKEETKSCPICLDNFEDQITISKLSKCGHIFCTHCIENLKEQNIRPMCPLCRREIRK